MSEASLPYEIPLPHRSLLGEGPVWDEAHQAIFWVDILSGKLHEYLPALQQHHIRDLGEMVGAVALLPNGDFLAALKSGLVILDRTTGDRRDLCHPESRNPGNRYNDGKCDPQGRFWIGSMALDESPGAGSLYRLDSDLQARRMVSGVGISNGLAWSPDHRTLYYIDSQEQAVAAFDFDPGTGAISGRRTAFRIPEQEGSPDGMTIDTAGKLWIAHWDGWQVARWDPDTGEKLLTVPLPAARITSCCFGGPACSDLYITSARVGLSDAELAKQPAAGALFVIRGTGYQGYPPDRFGQHARARG